MSQPSAPARTISTPPGWTPPRRRSSFVLFEDAWDSLVSRVLPGAFFLLVLMSKASALYQFLSRSAKEKAELDVWAFSFSLSYQVLLVTFLASIVVLFIIRSEPLRKAEGLWPRLLSQAGAFILTAVAAMPQRTISWQVDAAASALLAGGMAISLMALVHLGRCFSIMPEVRGVVLTGPYGYIRHPMYLGEFISGAGMVLGSLSWTNAAIFALFVWLQARRMNYEERGLRNFFPRYDAHVLQTKRLIPWVY